MSVSGKPFQPSLMFVSRATTYLSEAPFRCSNIGQTPDLIHKHWTIPEKLARDKHASLLLKFVNYVPKKFIALVLGGKVSSKKVYFFTFSHFHIPMLAIK